MAECVRNTDDLIGAMEAYVPFNEQEMRDREMMLSMLKKERDELLRRELPHAHMTASAWVISPDARMVLMAYHNTYHSWSWLGGHADGDADLLSVARREVMEESGAATVIPVSDQIFSMESLTVDGHEKKGLYVSSHLHLNVTYLFMADPREQLRVKRDENSAVKWFPKEEALLASNEVWFRERIYSKLNRKLELVKEDDLQRAAERFAALRE